MAMTINTNVVSINAQRNLSLSGNSLSTSMQRLSSGMRVNGAKDDAAGLAIAERMNAAAKGMTVAARNANDGISLAQTAEGALGKVGDMLQRMRELSVQSSNATNSADDRKALQAEVSQLKSEIDRVAKTTSFNGTKILDGTFGGGVFQVGANAGDNISVGGIANAKVAELGTYNYGASTSAAVKPEVVTGYASKIDAGTLKIRVGTGAAVDLGEVAAANSGSERMGQVVAAINAKTADTGVVAFMQESATTPGAFQMQLRSASGDSVSLEGFSASRTGFGTAVSLGLNATGATTEYDAGKKVIDSLAALTKKDDLSAELLVPATGAGVAAKGTLHADLAAITTALTDADAKAIWTNALAAFDTVVAAAKVNNGDATTPKWEFDDAGASRVLAATKDLQAAMDQSVLKQAEKKGKDIYSKLDALLKETDGAKIQAAVTAVNAEMQKVSTGFTALPTLAPALTATSKPEEILAAKNRILGLVDDAMSGGVGVNAPGEAVKRSGIDKLDISTQAGSWEAIKQIDSALDQVNAARGQLGALQTRFEKTVENIDIMTENVTASRGRIVDADFAKETASLSRSQILQQAGTAMVAQANQLPQSVLSLLK